MKKTALITGASSGIGKELAYIHAEQTGDLVIVARSRDKLIDVKDNIEAKLNRKVLVMSKDLSKTESSKEIYDELKSKNIEIEYLINNAGFGGQGYFHERSWEDDYNMIQVNIVALTALSKFFLPDFVKRGSGKILNVGSTASFTPGPLQAVYFATKSYVRYLSNAISEEVKGTGITVTNLMPGATETKFAEVSGMDKTSLFSNTSSAKEVALEGYKGMLNNKRDVLAGVTFMQGIMMRLMPYMPMSFKLKTIMKMQKVKNS